MLVGAAGGPPGVIAGAIIGGLIGGLTGGLFSRHVIEKEPIKLNITEFSKYSSTPPRVDIRNLLDKANYGYIICIYDSDKLGWFYPHVSRRTI